VVGARPQFVKAAAVSRAIARHDDLVELLVHTGQHYDDELSAAFFADLDLPEPVVNLGVGSGPHGRQTGAMLERLEAVLIEQQPDAVLVYGDTNSTLAGALAAAKLGLPVAHVEAGLRSGRREMAEEVNRVVTDHLSRLLFAPSERAVANLAAEGIVDGVHLVGDVMLDVLRWTMARTGPGSLGPRSPYALATVHRAETTDDPVRLAAVLDGLGRVVAAGLPVILPLHPRTRAALDGWEPRPGLTVVAPLRHGELLRTAGGAAVVLTDSGGLQKEAYWLGVPCVTLRDETEWTETVDAGWNVLAGVDPARILAAVDNKPPPGGRPALYGDGHAAEAVVRELAATLRG
jgi:UDP-GlcNAc3NAcA epimerase